MPKASVEHKIQQLEEAMGLPTASSRYRQIDNTAISQLAAHLPTVSLSVFRWEKAGGIFSARKIRKSLGFYHNVRATELLDFPGWALANHLGGGEPYEVDVYDPGGLVKGPQYSFQVNVPGVSLVPPRIGAMENQHAVQEASHVENIAGQLMEAGVAPAMAYQQAQEIVKTSPAAVLALMGEEDGVATTTKDPFESLMKLMMLKSMMAEPPSRPPVPAPSGPDPQVLALNDKIERLERLLTEQASKGREDMLHQRLADLDKRLSDVLLRKPEGPSDVALMLQSLGNTLGGQKDQLANILTQHQTQTVDLMKVLLDRKGNDEGPAKVLTESLISMMRGQIEIVQARMQEPVVQAESMAKVLGTMGGMIQAMAQMTSGPNDPPHIQLMKEFVAEVPEILDRMVGRKSLRQTQDEETGLTPEDYSYLQARQRQIQQLTQDQAALHQARAAAEQAQLQPRQPTPLAPQEPQSELSQSADAPSVPPRGGDEEIPFNAAVGIAEQLGIDMEEIIRADEEWPFLFVLLTLPNASPHVVGRRWAEKIHRTVAGGVKLPEDVEQYLSHPETFAEALCTHLGWDVGRANAVIGGVRRYLKEAKVEAVHVPDAEVTVS